MNLKPSFVLCVFLLTIHLEYTWSTFHHHRIFHNGPFDNFPHFLPMPFKFPRRPPVVDGNHVVRFNLYTRQNPYTPQVLETATGFNGLMSTNLKMDRRTKVLIQGFVDSASDSTSGEWMNYMRDAFLSTEDVNVIVMDYSVVALFLFYVTNLPQLSSGRLAELIYFMHKNGAHYDSFHLIGRSWGSHVAGMTGKIFEGQLGRITGLDPSTLPFKSIGSSCRLDKTNAQFVDIYHLNGKNQFFFLNMIGMADTYDGLSPPSGTVDVYPNYRTRHITGCPISNASLYTPSCQLGLGARLFIETILRSNAFPVCYCDNFLRYIRGECQCDSRNLMLMGNNIPMTATGVYQLADMDNSIIVQQVQGTTETILLTPSTASPSSSTTANLTEDVTVTDVSTTATTTTTTESSTTEGSTTTLKLTTVNSTTLDPIVSSTTDSGNQEVVTTSEGTAEGRQSAKILPRTSKVSSFS